ncbi:hypothetical protein CLPU_1c00120 [Gottschalkia purinilytica]|uniref:Uncharacterized protein n=1 Tax=Gottschalkia purinilytica TaxID=1503 RepID=A0A0L0WEE1_GOTPU|nr:hypothetical protein [Gottschalkia purinilytica]KNF09847.1 hypothetical protein CLPU_1c00120 [Gottschalkia purinilytica]
MQLIKNKEAFEEECWLFSSSLYNFVEKHCETDSIRWFFDSCYMPDYYTKDSYTVIFKSYDIEEYKDYILSIEVTYEDNNYNFRIIKQVP